MRTNLVLAVVGDESVHPQWLCGDEPRQFDLALVYYGKQPGRFAADAEHYIERRGLKFQLLDSLIHGELAPVLPQYAQIWLPDDDVSCDVATINRLFRIGSEHRLQICQPAIAAGEASYRTLRRDERFVLRYTGYVEMMCPLFTAEAFRRVAPLFGANRSGWGLDWVWSSWFSEEQVAVIDAASVVHTRPLGSGGARTHLAAMGVDPAIEQDELLKLHRLNVRRRRRAVCSGAARVRGLRTDGTIQWNRPLWNPWFRNAA